MVFSPAELVARLAALVPPPQKNAVIYHGVLGGNAAFRSRVVPKPEAEAEESPALVTEERRTRHRRRHRTWSWLLMRVFGLDGWLCPHCSKPMTLRVPQVGPPATLKILRDLQRSARGPPATCIAAPRA